MTGPEHYAEAESILAACAKTGATSAIAEAQVHATLALAAAAAEPIAQSYDGTYDTAIPAAWSKAIS